jgi:hypothetical protein
MCAARGAVVKPGRFGRYLAHYPGSALDDLSQLARVCDYRLDDVARILDETPARLRRLAMADVRVRRAVLPLAEVVSQRSRIARRVIELRRIGVRFEAVRLDAPFADPLHILRATYADRDVSVGRTCRIDAWANLLQGLCDL